MKHWIYFIILIILPFADMHAQSAPSHDAFTKILQKHVDDNGRVDYQGLKTNVEKLDRYLGMLQKNPPQTSWSDSERKAYLINAYNGFTLKLIVSHFPVESIKDIGGFLESPFSIRFAKLGTQTYSLDNIEKDMLLKMNDPRVHFAINCASASCPKLNNKAFEAYNLDETLDQMTCEFIQSELNNISKTQVELSKIFKWYRADFEKDAGSLINFINRYTTTTVDQNADIDYLDYSWALNSSVGICSKKPTEANEYWCPTCKRKYLIFSAHRLLSTPEF